jgi:hypothetical protein
MRSLFLPALALALFVPAAAAQAPAIDVRPPLDAPLVAVEPGWTEVPVAWTVTFRDAFEASAALADGRATLAWTLSCGEHALRLENATTPVPLDPGAPDSSGVARLRLQAAPGTLGMEPLPCTLTADFRSTAATGRQETAFAPVVQFVDGLEVAVPSAVKVAGPQRQVPYALEVTNTGNSLLQVAFELVERPAGRWNAILPETLLVEPGATGTAIFTVATPYGTGYNHAEGSFLVRVLPAAALDPSVAGEPQEVALLATSKGWYVPGPGPALVLAGLAAAAALLRRRA